MFHRGMVWISTGQLARRLGYSTDHVRRMLARDPGGLDVLEVRDRANRIRRYVRLDQVEGGGRPGRGRVHRRKP